MLFDAKNNKEEIFATLKHELHRGALDHKHPFRFLILGTSQNNEIDQRYVVLRKVDEDFYFYIYTDYRSAKVSQIKTQQKISLLFYHPQKRVQIKLKGEAKLHNQDDLTSLLWKNVQGEAQKAYNSNLPPGRQINHPSEAFDWIKDLSNQANFCVIKIQISSLEALQLNGLEHLRIRFQKIKENWEGKWLVP